MGFGRPPVDPLEQKRRDIEVERNRRFYLEAAEASRATYRVLRRLPEETAPDEPVDDAYMRFQLDAPLPEKLKPGVYEIVGTDKKLYVSEQNVIYGRDIPSTAFGYGDFKIHFRTIMREGYGVGMGASSLTLDFPGACVRNKEDGRFDDKKIAQIELGKIKAILELANEPPGMAITFSPGVEYRLAHPGMFEKDKVREILELRDRAKNMLKYGSEANFQKAASHYLAINDQLHHNLADVKAAKRKLDVAATDDEKRAALNELKQAYTALSKDLKVIDNQLDSMHFRNDIYGRYLQSIDHVKGELTALNIQAAIDNVRAPGGVAAVLPPDITGLCNDVEQMNRQVSLGHPNPADAQINKLKEKIREEVHPDVKFNRIEREMNAKSDNLNAVKALVDPLVVPGAAAVANVFGVLQGHFNNMQNQIEDFARDMQKLKDQMGKPGEKMDDAYLNHIQTAINNLITAGAPHASTVLDPRNLDANPHPVTTFIDNLPLIPAPPAPPVVGAVTQEEKNQLKDHFKRVLDSAQQLKTNVNEVLDTTNQVIARPRMP